MNAQSNALQDENPADLHQLTGKVIAGRFRVLGLYHVGPRGAVYEVEPPGVGRERRALKTLDMPEAREPDALERLTRFIEIAESIRHPHLEDIHEMGFLPDQTIYLLTEWLPISTLAEALAAGGRMHVHRAHEVIRSVAEGLAMLHERGLSHGDIRPGHVLLVPAREGYLQVKLVGAGIAARLEIPLAGPIEGAWSYTAPERLQGKRSTGASDIYALGALAYRLFAGRHVFEPNDPRANHLSLDPIERLSWLHLNAAPHRPTAVVNGLELSPAVERVIGRALSKAPEERFATARAFLKAFERAFNNPERFEAEADFSPVFSDSGAKPVAIEILPSPPPLPPIEDLKAPSFGLRRWALIGAFFGALGALLSMLLRHFPI